MIIDTLQAIFTADDSRAQVVFARVISAAQMVEQAMISMAIQGGKAWLDYSAKLEQTKIGFTTLMNSSDAAGQHIKQLQEFARSTPFDFAGLADASRRFQGVGVEANKIIPLMTDVGNAAAAAGASSQQLDRITVALSQIISKGKLSAEEVNQLAENGIPAWQMLSETLGKSKGEIMKLSEQGAISSDLFLEAFQQFSQINFGGAMEAQSRTFLGAMSNISDTVMTASQTAFAPLYDKISNLAQDMAAELDAQGDDFRGIGEVIIKYISDGIGLGLGTLVGSLAADMSKRLGDIFSGREFLDPRFKGMASGLYDGFMSGLGYESAGERVSSMLTPELANVKKSIADIKKEGQKLPNLREKLDAQKAAAELEKMQKKVGEIVRNLAVEIRFFGDDSKEAGAKQKLLAAGVTDFNTALAQSAISLARQLDAMEEMRTGEKILTDLRRQVEYFGDETEVAAVKQRLLSEGFKDFTSGTAQMAISLAAQLDALDAADKQKKKVEDLKNEIVKMRDDATFEINFPNATELDKFTDWVKRNASGFKQLAPEIAKTRAELAKLSFNQAVGKRNDKIGSFVSEIKSEIASLSDVKQNFDFEELVQKLVEPLNLDKADKGAITPKRFAERIHGFIDTWATELRDAGTDVERQKKISDDYWDIVDGFLKYSKVKTGNPDQPFANIFADSFDYEHALALLNLYNAVDAARKKAFAKTFEENKSNIEDAELDAMRQKIEFLKASHGEKEVIHFAELELARKEEEAGHRHFIAEIERQKAELAGLKFTTEQKAQILAQYNQQIEAENIRHNAALGTINAGADQFSITGRLSEMMSELPTYKKIWDDFVVSLPNSMGDALGQIARDWDGTWGGLADSAKKVFGQMLLDLAQQYLQSAFSKLIGMLVGALVGGIGGGMGGGADTMGHEMGHMSGFADGGLPPTNRPSIIGERGPEIFVPRVGGRILSNDESRKALAGGGGKSEQTNNTTIINQTIHSPRNLVAPKSARQVADATLSAASRATKGNR